MSEEFQMRVNAEGVVSILRANLTALYTDRFCIIQEMLQNADDAKAKHVHFGVSGPLDVDHPLGELKALFIINDGPVSRSNMQSIYTVASGDKGDAGDKIGKFGLGMKSVFHLCEGFFMFGEGLDSDLTFPYFCTPWTSEYQPEWHEQWPGVKAQMAAAVKKAIGKYVDGWNRWFCVWLPLREESMHAGDCTKPIIQEYPEDCDIDVITGREYAGSAARMLPLLRCVEQLSFSNRTGNEIRFVLEPSGRLTGETGDLLGHMVVAEGELEPYEYIGEEKKIISKDFKSLQSLRIWPMSTRFVSDGPARGLRSYPDKTDSHVAICIIKEKSDNPSLSIVPCMNLPLGIVRKSPGEHIKKGIGGKHSVTVELHGCFFVDPARINFKMGEVRCDNPSSETGLCEEWNRRLFFDGVLPLVVPGLFKAIQEQKWDEETISCVMRAIGEVPYLRGKKDDICRTEGIVRVLGRCKSEDRWAKINISDGIKVYAIEPPRSDKVRAVIADALEVNEYVIDANAGRLFPAVKVNKEFPPWLCERFLSVIAGKPSEEVDNEILRQFAQECAEGVDFYRMPDKIKDAEIWKAGGRRYSYNQLVDMASLRRLYCHAEGDLKKIFEAAVEWSLVQINEPLAAALKLDVPDFTERFVLEILQECPRVSSAETRRPLLEILLQKRYLHGEYEWIKACRYLAHGESDLFDCDEELFMPLDGEYADISAKMVDAITKSKYGACCHLPKVITEILTPANQETLKLPMSRADKLVLKFSSLRTFDDVSFADDDWRALVMMVPNMLDQTDVKEALKRIPAFPTFEGTLTAITKDVFRENKDFGIPDELSHRIKLIKIEGDGLASRRLERLSVVWNPNDCIRVADQEPLACSVRARIFKNSLAKFNEYISPDVENILKSRSWVELRDGRIVSPEGILKIGEMSDLVAGCVTIADIADAEVAGLIKKYSLSLGESSSVERLFDLMAVDAGGRFSIGRFESPDGTSKIIDANTLSTIMTGDGEKHLPAVTILNRLKGQRVSFSAHIDKLRGRLTDKQLTAIIQILTSSIDNDATSELNDKIYSLLYSYLDEAAELGNFIRDIVPQLKFFNKNNALKKSKDLCFGVDGISDKYILSDNYKNATGFIYSINSKVMTLLPTGFDKLVSFKEYFSGWDQEFADRIGGFIICCSDQPEDLSLTKKRYGFESRSIEEARNGIWNELNAFLRNQHCYIIATSDEQVDVISISGEKMAITATPLASADSLFCGQSNTCEYVCNSVLEMSMGNPPMPKEDHSLILRLRKLDAQTMVDIPQTKLDALFRNTLDIVFDAYKIQSPATDQFWESLKHSEQLAVRVTKSIILQSLNTYLPMINCRDEGLKDTFTKWHDLAYSEAEAEQHGNSAQVSRYRDQRADLQKELEKRISTDISLSEEILKALRAKMQDYQYDIDSMLFELFQNADDATEELHDMYGSDAPALPDRFCVRYDGHNLIVAHWGRTINQTKVGADSGSKYAAFRADLQKMLMLSQSGKGRVDVKVSGKFGLGFKTVFLVCDIPCVTSGKLKFKILGGLLPEPLDEEEESSVRYITSEFDGVESVIKPTVFVLPLRKDVREKVAEAVGKFAKQIDVLSAFSHRIKNISVIGTDGVEVVARKVPDAGLHLMEVKDAQLLLGEKDGRLEPLDKDVATYWVTAPTEMRAELGIALNADFDLDPGRSYLNLRSEKNAALIPRIAEGLYEKLIRVYDSSGGESRKNFFSRLFDIVAGSDGLENWRDDGSHAAANAMREVFWGRSCGAFLRLLRERPVIPSGLPGVLDVLCLLGDVEQMVCKAIADSELLKLIPHGRLEPGKTVAESKLMKLGRMFFPDAIRGVPLYTVHKLLDDIRESYVSASPEWCGGEEAGILLSALTKVDKTGLDVLQRFEFKTCSGALRVASELVIADGNEALKASFMPPEFILSDEYGEQGVGLAKICRGERRLKTHVFVAQAAVTSDLEAQVAVLKYLANGSPSDEFKKELCEIRDDCWLFDWRNSLASKQLSRREKDRIADALSANEEEYNRSMSEAWGEQTKLPFSEDPTKPRAPISISAVRDWWRIHAEEELCDYNIEIYGQVDVGKLPLKLKSLDDRKAWMQVLVLGAAHSLGLKCCQHKGFIVELKRRGYWDVYCKSDLQASEWLDTIDDFLVNEELNGGKYNYWMRLFFRIYQFSKNLDGYVQLFESWNGAEKCEAPNLASVKKNSMLSGSGIDAPGLEKALSLTGLHFVYREMVRRHAISNPVIYPQCFVPYEKVSEVAWNVRVSSEIYRRIVSEIGERDAIFGGAFDIALTQYDKHGRED